MSALTKIRKAGFVVNLSEGGVEIRPSSRLTEQQRNFIKTHREEILAELIVDQAKMRFSHWRIVSQGRKREITIIPPQTMDEMQHVYRSADLIEPLVDLPE
ncbi:hypothetical protein U737_17975 [Methylomonas sp. LW13]|uniref:hypothetical protein n=1 Tax=unclassified Methylomonas TaxID=2608980 RepID=UPI00051C8062|nr:hypothetical protein [Methylomonas sp. LW13]QBC28641.1 hypothetical protein U737_17975 [Methylomonas sp. LW13]